jgi:hypothetical protein
MKSNAKTSAILIAIMMATFSISKADLPTYADGYPHDAAGYGLHGHFINSDNLIDLVTTNADPMVGGYSWFNDSEDPGHFSRDQAITGGREAKFGFLTSNDRWRLAIAAGNHIAHYSVDAESEELYQEQTIYNYAYPADFLCWGHVNGDEYGDVVATDDGSTNGVLIYVGYHWVDLQMNDHYSLNPTWNPDPFFPGCNLNQLALVRMHDFWNLEWRNRWDLLAVDGSNSNNIKLFHNNGSGGFTTASMQTLDAVDPIRDFALGNLDDGQYTDLVLCTNDGEDHYVKTFLNTGNGTFETTANQSQSFDGIIHQVALGDYNHDYHADLVVYWDGGRIDVYLNDGDGNFNFGTPLETCYTPDYGTYDVEANELMFVDLGGNNLYSVAMTGVENATDPGLWIWFNDGVSPVMHPVPGVNLDGVPGGHPTIQWIECEDWTVDKYVIYRALMEDTTRPTQDDFDSLTFVSHPTTVFTDTTVLIHTENDNYKIWYTVTAMDDADHESIKHDFVTFWGYYEDSQGFRVCEGVSYASPSAFAVKITPNPFNPTTAISFDLPESGLVELGIFDVRGRPVTTLIDGNREAGSYQVTFDASHLPSGIYLYRLTAGSFNATGKMVLMK